MSHIVEIGEIDGASTGHKKNLKIRKIFNLWIKILWYLIIPSLLFLFDRLVLFEVLESAKIINTILFLVEFIPICIFKFYEDDFVISCPKHEYEGFKKWFFIIYGKITFYSEKDGKKFYSHMRSQLVSFLNSKQYEEFKNYFHEMEKEFQAQYFSEYLPYSLYPTEHNEIIDFLGGKGFKFSLDALYKVFDIENLDCSTISKILDFLNLPNNINDINYFKNRIIQHNLFINKINTEEWYDVKLRMKNMKLLD